MNAALPDQSTARTRQFVLQAEDPDTGCPALEARFVVDDLCAIRSILAGEADDDTEMRHLYSLSNEQITAIFDKFGVAFDPNGRATMLTPWHGIRQVPYLVHTGFELALMLDDRKPLAVFIDEYPWEWADKVAARFDPYVAQGRFVRRIVDRPSPEGRRSPDGTVFEGIRETYIATAGQAWRIDAHMLLQVVAAKSGWNDALERFEGSLLGYDDWQNDWWFQHRQTLRGSISRA